MASSVTTPEVQPGTTKSTPVSNSPGMCLLNVVVDPGPVANVNPLNEEVPYPVVSVPTDAVTSPRAQYIPKVHVWAPAEPLARALSAIPPAATVPGIWWAPLP